MNDTECSLDYVQLYKDPNKIDWKTPVAIDFETYYDKEYSLSKITMEKYIRCDKFECIGVAVKIGNNPTHFYKGETGIEIIRHIVTTTYPNSPVVAQNCPFDMGILAFRYGIHPNFMVDTMVMAKLSGFDRVAGGTGLAKMSAQLEKMGIFSQVKGNEVHNMLGVHAGDMTPRQWQAYGDYCKLDVDLTHALYRYMIDKVPVSELIMSDITTKMYTKPMFDIDVPLLAQYAVRLETERDEMLGRIAGQLGFNDNKTLLSNLRSSKKFVAVLERLNVTVPMKWSEKKQEMIPAVSKTDTEFLDLLEHDDELVRTLVETKLGTMSSLAQTRTENFLDIASRGLFPVALRYASAHTGRYGGGDGNGAKGSTNVQNLPKRTGDTTLRKSLRAKDGHVVIATDSTQVECLAGDGLVLTNNGLKQIVNISIDDLLWDGIEYVPHDGVIFKGVKDVITYSGITATPEHIVFTTDGRDITLDEASAERAEILVGEREGQPIRGGTLMGEMYLRYGKAGVLARRETWQEQKLQSVQQPQVLTYTKQASRPTANALQRFTERGSLITGTIPVYDIVNAGVRNRFCYNGMIVSNCRINALVSNQQDLTQLFLDGRDPYVDMATAIFNRPYDEILHEAKVVGSKDGKKMRNLGKEAILACGYGMSANTFRNRMELTGNLEASEMADEIVQAYRTKNYKIVQFWRECDRVLKVMYAGGSCWFGGPDNNLFYADGSSVFHGVKIPSIRFPNGTYLFYQNLRLVEDNGREQFVYDQFKGRGFQPNRVWGSLCDENLCQKLAFDILKYQAIEIAKTGLPINLNVHDEWVSVVPRDQAPQAVVVHYTAMKSVPDYIPQGLLDCEVDVGLTYADLKTVDVGRFL